MQRIANLYLCCIRNASVRISSPLNRYVSSSFSANNIPRISVVRKIPKRGFVVVPAGSATRSTVTLLAFTFAGLMKFLGLSEDEDSELVQILKRGEVELLKKEYNRSEQLFHVALKVAQDLQNEDGITYVYDRLANVAFESGQNEKARKLFVDVMQRLLGKGMSEDDIVLIHISFKLAKIYEHVKDYKTAEMGYLYCIDSLKPQLQEENPDYNNIRELWLTILNGYAYFHYNLGHWKEALKWFHQAHDVCVQINGEQNEQTVLLLNNLGSVYNRLGDSDTALTYFHKAEKIGKAFPDMENYAYVYLNLAYLYLEHKMFDEAKRYCSRAGVNASRLGNDETKQESEECLLKVAEAIQQKSA